MAKSGIKKYDKLPARVGWIDVDFLRHEYASSKSKLDAVKRLLDEAIEEQQEKENGQKKSKLHNDGHRPKNR